VFCAVLLLGLAGALACTTSGRKFDVDGISGLEPGHTTENQVRDMFGSPISIRTHSYGGSAWTYEFREEVRHDTGMLSRIGQWIARFFGFRTYGSPVNLEYKNEIEHRLVVFFDDDAIVEDYSYEKTETPTRRVY